VAARAAGWGGSLLRAACSLLTGFSLTGGAPATLMAALLQPPGESDAAVPAAEAAAADAAAWLGPDALLLAGCGAVRRAHALAAPLRRTKGWTLAPAGDWWMGLGGGLGQGESEGGGASNGVFVDSNTVLLLAVMAAAVLGKRLAVLGKRLLLRVASGDRPSRGSARGGGGRRAAAAALGKVKHE
jgi:hypothetical protein